MIWTELSSLFLPSPGSSPVRIWLKNTCTRQWARHSYQVSSKSIKWNYSTWNFKIFTKDGKFILTIKGWVFWMKKLHKWCLPVDFALYRPRAIQLRCKSPKDIFYDLKRRKRFTGYSISLKYIDNFSKYWKNISLHQPLSMYFNEIEYPVNHFRRLRS